MDPEEKRNLRIKLVRQFREKFTFFAGTCLKVRAKNKKIVTFKFNRVQRYVHAKLEQQLAKTGKVRVLILKGRQQGVCLAPNTPIMLANYKWCRLENIVPGDRLMAFDEMAPHQKGLARAMCTAEVEAVIRRRQPCFKLTFASGATLLLSKTHRMLCKQRGGTYTQWREAETMVVGDVIRRILHAPDKPPQDAGWAAGAIDADGSIPNAKVPRVSFSQCEGAILDRFRQYLLDLGVHWYENTDKRTKCGSYTKLGDNPVVTLRIDKFADIVKLFSAYRITKQRNIYEGRKMPTSGTGFVAWDEIINIRDVGVREVIDLQTSTKTFIANGLASHNSTYVAARFYWQASLWKGVNVYILSHEQRASDGLFKIVDRYQAYNPYHPRTGTANAKTLEFDRLGSTYTVATAGQKAGGRGGTGTLFHGSEVAFWDNAADHFAASVQTVPDEEGTEIILETTANGPVGEFYERWQDAQAGDSDYIAIFIPWYWQEEYRREPEEDFQLQMSDNPDIISEIEYAELFGLDNDQMRWRRAKIQELRSHGLFNQEYPATAEMAFVTSGEGTYIPPLSVLRARKRKVDGDGPLIMGADPAGPGGDRFAIARRRGHECDNVKWRNKLSTSEAYHWCKAEILEHTPARFFIDAGGIGSAVLSLLREDQDIPRSVVRGVNFGEKSQAKKARPNKPGPKNRRAEMWTRMKNWLEGEEPVDIPDIDALQADITAPRLLGTLTNDIQLETKESMRKRKVRSPDLGDALALTFASDALIKDYVPKSKAVAYGNPDSAEAPTRFRTRIASGKNGWMS